MPKPLKAKDKPPQKQRSSQPPRSSKTKKITQWSSVVVATIGVLAAAAAFLPRMTVTPDGSIDPVNPYPISFTITNTNFIPLHSMNVYLGLCYLGTGPPLPIPCKGPYKSRLVRDSWQNHTLTMDERFTITLDDLLRIAPPAKFAGADISIIVSYHPWLIPFRREKEFRFATKFQSDGRLHWLSLPLDSDVPASGLPSIK